MKLLNSCSQRWIKAGSSWDEGVAVGVGLLGGGVAVKFWVAPELKAAIRETQSVAWQEHASQDVRPNLQMWLLA